MARETRRAERRAELDFARSQPPEEKFEHPDDREELRALPTPGQAGNARPTPHTAAEIIADIARKEVLRGLSARDAEILRRALDGASRVTIARAVGLTPQRVGQIVKKTAQALVDAQPRTDPMFDPRLFARRKNGPRDLGLKDKLVAIGEDGTADGADDGLSEEELVPGWILALLDLKELSEDAPMRKKLRLLWLEHQLTKSRKRLGDIYGRIEKIVTRAA